MSKKCEFCPSENDVKNKVKSVYHKHHSARGVTKKIYAQVTFHDELTGSKVSICEYCQRKVISGMSNGGNWD